MDDHVMSGGKRPHNSSCSFPTPFQDLSREFFGNSEEVCISSEIANVLLLRYVSSAHVSWDVPMVLWHCNFFLSQFKMQEVNCACGSLSEHLLGSHEATGFISSTEKHETSQ